MMNKNQKEKGQLVLEYVLLLLVVVSAASLLLRRLTSTSADSPGIFISKWCEISRAIAGDDPNVRGQTAQTPGCQ